MRLGASTTEFETELVPLIGTYPSPGQFNPMTGPISTVELDEVRFRLFAMASSGNPLVGPAVQFSDDGVTWPNAAVSLGYTDATVPDGWDNTSFRDWKDLWALGTTKRLFARFGLLARRTATGLASASARLVVETRGAVTARTLVGGPIRVSSTSAGLAHLFIGPVGLPGVTEARFTVQFEAVTNTIEWNPTVFGADTEATITTGKSPVVVGSYAGVGSATTVFGTSFLAIPSSEQLDRFLGFGLTIKTPSPQSDVRFAHATLRVDVR